MNIFICACVGLFIIFIPFLPAMIEVMRSSDSQALKITNHILKDPRSTPALLLWHFAHLLGAEDLVALQKRATVTEATLLNETIFAVPPGPIGDLPKNVSRVISAGSLELKARTNYLSKIISLRSIRTGEQNALNEIHAKERLTLGAKSKVMWWASAEDVVIENDLELPGKIQAARSIIVNGKAQFHHFESPVIDTANHVADDRIDFFVESSPSPVRHTHPENCEVRTGETLVGDLIVRHDLILHEDAKIQGNVKVHQNVILKNGAQISGNLVALGDIICEGNNWVGGSILGKKDVFLKAGCQVGSHNQRVTVSGETLKIKAPFRSHGTLRAWTRGEFI